MTPRRCLREALERIYAEDGVWTDSLAALIKAAEAVLDEGTQPDGAAMLRELRDSITDLPVPGVGKTWLRESVSERNRVLSKIDELLARAPKAEPWATTFNEREQLRKENAELRAKLGRRAGGCQAMTIKLSELRRLAEEATPGEWRWAWRKDDEHAPGSVFSEVSRGHAYAVAMCPRYGKSTFAKDAPFIAAANPATLLRLLEIAEAAMLVKHDGLINHFTKLEKALEGVEP